MSQSLVCSSKLCFQEMQQTSCPAHVVPSCSEEELSPSRVGWVLAEVLWCQRTALQSSALCEVIPHCSEMGPGLAFGVLEARFLGVDSEESTLMPNRNATNVLYLQGFCLPLGLPGSTSMAHPGTTASLMTTRSLMKVLEKGSPSGDVSSLRLLWRYFQEEPVSQSFQALSRMSNCHLKIKTSKHSKEKTKLTKRERTESQLLLQTRRTQLKWKLSHLMYL